MMVQHPAVNNLEQAEARGEEAIEYVLSIETGMIRIKPWR
jgi:hypothetical protein